MNTFQDAIDLDGPVVRVAINMPAAFLMQMRRQAQPIPAAVGPIKSMISKIDLPEIEAAMTGWLASPPADFRGELINWAQQRNITCDSSQESERFRR